MKKILVLFVLILLFYSASLSDLRAESVESIVNESKINACSIAYSEDGKTTFENFSTGITETSVYELASNGKLVAAYITLSLIDEGKLSLDSKIMNYLPADLLTTDKRLNDITVRQLLSHTAGFSPSYELGIDKKLYSSPGEEFRYSGVGYIYLQSVIESVSGLSMEQAAEEYVFNPLGMQNSTYEKAKTVVPYMKLSSAILFSLLIFIVAFCLLFLLGAFIGRVTKFKYFSLRISFVVAVLAAFVINALFLLFIFLSKVLVVFLVFFTIVCLLTFLTRKSRKAFYAILPVFTVLVIVLSLAVPITIPVTNDIIAKKANCAYSLKSTSSDMALFCDELMKQYNGSNEIMKGMFQSAINIDSTNSWGLGIAIERESQDRNTYWHSGMNPGFQSLIVLYPEQNKYIIVLTNSDDGLELSKSVAKNMLGINGKWDIKR